MIIELGAFDTLVYLYLDCVKQSIVRQHSQCLNKLGSADVDKYQRLRANSIGCKLNGSLCRPVVCLATCTCRSTRFTLRSTHTSVRMFTSFYRSSVERKYGPKANNRVCCDWSR